MYNVLATIDIYALVPVLIPIGIVGTIAFNIFKIVIMVKSGTRKGVAAPKVRVGKIIGMSEKGHSNIGKFSSLQGMSADEMLGLGFLTYSVLEGQRMQQFMAESQRFVEEQNRFMDQFNFEQQQQFNMQNQLFEQQNINQFNMQNDLLNPINPSFDFNSGFGNNPFGGGMGF